MIDKDVLAANLATLAVLLPIVHFVMRLDGPLFWITVILGEALWVGYEWRKPNEPKPDIETGRIEKDAV